MSSYGITVPIFIPRSGQMCPSKLVHAPIAIATQLKGLMAPKVCRSDQLPDPATAE